MSTLTIWAHASNKVLVVQLSDDPDDGTDAQQISHLKTVQHYANLTCVSANYTGAYPDTDAAYWVWDNGQVGTTTPVAQFSPLSAWQVRKVLTMFNLRTKVEAAILLADQATKDAWAFANEFQRDDALLNGMAQSMGMSSAQLDQLFEIGVTL